MIDPVLRTVVQDEKGPTKMSQSSYIINPLHVYKQAFSVRIIADEPKYPKI